MNAVSPEARHVTRSTVQVFVAHAVQDRHWVNGVLLPSLGLEPGAVTTSADLRPGESRLAETERHIRAAAFTVLVLTPEFLADEWSVLAELLAGHDATEGPGRLVPVLLRPSELPLRLDFRVVLDCTDESTWPDALARLRATVGSAPSERAEPPCPYPGMASFRLQEAPFFFGRGPEADELARRLTHQALVVIIGPSGSGKSSLASAGVVPRLSVDQRSRTVLTFRPGPDPLAALLGALGGGIRTATARDPVELLQSRIRSDGAEHLLIICDQLEEGLAAPPERSGPFLRALESLRGSGLCSLLITVRADFMSELMSSALWPLGPGERFDIVPLRGAALASAIRRPAEAVGVYLEPTLVERLVNDTEGEPGALPLVQEALVLLWERRFQRYLSLRSYELLGARGRSGVAVALAIRADATLAGMGPRQQALTRRILLRLIQLGEGRKDTRRQQKVDALSAGLPDRALFSSTLDRLVERRLVVLSGPDSAGAEATMADIAHEAMIDGWPTLRAWMDESRADELQRRRIEADAEEWDDHQGGTLYRGRRLAESLAWMRRHPDELAPSARRLVAASVRRRLLLRTVAALAVVALLGGVAWLATPVVRDALRRAEAQSLGPMVALPSASVVLGNDLHVNRPRRLVQVPALGIEVHEVSNGQYRLCVEAGRCLPPSESYTDATYARGWDELPVTYLTSYQAADYCRWVGRSLPTVDQWERAAGGREGRRYPWGDGPPNSARVNAIVGTREPTGPVPVSDGRFAEGRTPEGIEHVIGNVGEWTSSPVRDLTPADAAPGEEVLAWGAAWNGEDLIHTVAIKGGEFSARPYKIAESRVAEANSASKDIGFRCADIV